MTAGNREANERAMPRLGKCSSFTRSMTAAFAALVLALRVIGGAGYMPMVDHGRLTIALCPDGEWTAPSARPVAMPGMDMALGGGMEKGAGHGSKSGDHRDPCPFAAASSVSAVAGAPPAVSAATEAGLAPPLSSPLPALVSNARVERPFATGPPIPA